MTHQGNNTMSQRLFEALSSLESAAEVAALLQDLCTPREIEDFSQRLEVARMLAAGASYTDVSRATGASSTTVSRVSKCLNGKTGGYRMVLERLDGAGAGERDGAAAGADGVVAGAAGPAADGPARP